MKGAVAQRVHAPEWPALADLLGRIVAHEIPVFTEAQHLIRQVRARLTVEDYGQAEALLHEAPADRLSWTQQERDEVRCPEEFPRNLSSPLRV